MHFEGKSVVLLISFAYAFDGLYKMHVNYIFFAKKTHLIFLITVTAGLLNLPLTYYFVKSYGLMQDANKMNMTIILRIFKS